MLNHIGNKSKDTSPEAIHSCSQWHAPMWRCSSNLFKYGNNEQEHNDDADLNVWQQSMLILMMMSITWMTNLQRRQRSAPGQRPLFEKPMATQSLWLLAIMINVMVERHCPKFTISIFTPDPNLHKSQIYTGPKFTQTQIYTNPFSHIDSKKPNFTQKFFFKFCLNYIKWIPLSTLVS